MTRALCQRLSKLISILVLLLLPSGHAESQLASEWVVWLNVEQCQMGRQTWLAVAQDNPARADLAVGCRPRAIFQPWIRTTPSPARFSPHKQCALSQ